MPCAQGGTGSDGRAQARGSAVPGFRRGCVEGGSSRRLQAVHEKGRPVPVRPPAAARLRLEAARPHRLGADRAMVRPVQPGPLPAMPITRSTFSRRSSTSRSPAVTSKPTRRGTWKGTRDGCSRAFCPARRSLGSIASWTGRPATAGREQADIIRLLLLTGCRRSEILRLRWSEVDHDRLVLADGKTGPRIVPLNTPAPAHSRTPAARRKPVRLSVPERSRPGPATEIFRSGTAPGARRASRTFAFTISATPMPATR